MKTKAAMLSLFITTCFMGCSGSVGNVGQFQNFPYASVEAAWIRNGEPLTFEDELWYPTDNIEILLDKEMYILGEYQGVQFFVEKADIRPYNRLYTKFGNNQFRAFIKKND